MPSSRMGHPNNPSLRFPKDFLPKLGMTFYAYLLISENGKTYGGQTKNLKHRMADHNSPKNKGYTQGQKWYLLAAWPFETRYEALVFEKGLKSTKLRRRIIEHLPRTRILMERHDIPLPDISLN